MDERDLKSLERYLGGFTPARLPDGARARILAPALASVADHEPENGLGPLSEFFFFRPLRALALCLMLVAANIVADSRIPRLAKPGAFSASPGVSVEDRITRRGWLIGSVGRE